jgi:ubiquitin-protein ligase
MARKRIQKEILDLGKESLGDMTLEPSEASIFEWMGSIPGPTGSVYEGGVFNVKITLPNDYP